MAFVDGELPAEEASRIEALLKDRADLRRYVDRQWELRRGVREAFSSALTEPIPDRLMAALSQAPVSRRWSIRQSFARLESAWPGILRRFGMPVTAALACGLILGVVIGPQILGSGSSVLEQRNGALVAQGALANALSTRLASETANSALRVGVSFRAKDGRDCRSFQSDGAQAALAGIACRDPHDWSIVMLANAEKQNSADYQTAGSTMPDSIRNAISGMMSGAPFDAPAERAARERGWIVR
jgi:anti-sigma factor RsiW